MMDYPHFKKYSTMKHTDSITNDSPITSRYKQNNMTLQQAIEIVKQYQKWRRGTTDDMPYTPRETTEALDILLKVAKKQVKK